MKNTINKLNIDVLSDYKVIVLNKKVKCDYICLYPNGWKIENKLVLPSPIHYEESYISDITRDDFDDLVDKGKIISMNQVNLLFMNDPIVMGQNFFFPLDDLKKKK